MPMGTAPLINPVMATRIKAISNVFEVGSPEPDYAYVEDLGDGRGYTVTQYGFCTYNGEVAWAIENCNLCHSAKPRTPTMVHESTTQGLAAQGGPAPSAARAGAKGQP